MEPVEGERESLRVGGVVLDPGGHRVWAGTWHPLTPTELRILRCLMEVPGSVCSPGELVRRVWGYEESGCLLPPLRWHVRNLRRKVERDPAQPRVLLNLPWKGYLFDPEGAEAWRTEDPGAEEDSCRVPGPEPCRGSPSGLVRWEYLPRGERLRLDEGYRRLLGIPGEGELELPLEAYLRCHVVPEDREKVADLLRRPPGEGERERHQEGLFGLLTARGESLSLATWVWTSWSRGRRLLRAYGVSQPFLVGLPGRGEGVRRALEILAEAGCASVGDLPEPLVWEVWEAVGRSLGASGGLWLELFPDGEMVLVHHWGGISVSPEEWTFSVDPDSPWMGRLRRGELVTCNVFGGPRPASDLMRRFQGRACAALPLPRPEGGEIRGCLVLVWAQGERLWDPEELALLRLLGGWAGRLGSLSPRRPRPEPIRP